MNDYIPYLVAGISTGSIIGLSAMGLVLTYKTAGVFNFGHGAVSAAGAFVFYSLHVQAGIAWPLAMLVSICLFGPASGLVLERIATGLAGVTTTYRIVATVGILVTIRWASVLIYGEGVKLLPPFLPQDVLFTISGFQVSVEKILDLAIGVVVALVLFVLFKRTKLGLAMRAVVDDSDLIDLTGRRPATVRRMAWMIGGTFAAASGILTASSAGQVDVDVLSLLVVQAFGAAALARFASLPMAFLGGLVIGVLQGVVSKQVVSHPDLQGLDLNVPFLVLFIALLVVPRAKLVEVGRQVKARPLPHSKLRRAARLPLLLGLGALAVAVPHLVGSKLPLWNAAVAHVVLFLSLGLLVRVSGQISLCHIGFAAVGAATFAHLQADGLPWGIALLLAGAVTLPVGALIAIPAIRLSGLYLGLATLGFGIFLSQFLYTKDFMFGFGQKLAVSRPKGFESDERYYYVLLGLAVAAAAVVVVIERCRLGRLLRALADSPTALLTLGTGTRTSLVLVFCISAAMAGISGASYAALFGSVGGASFSYVNSLTALAVLAVALFLVEAVGFGIVPAAVVAAILLDVVPNYFSNADVTAAVNMSFGLLAIMAGLASQGRIGDRLATGAERWAERRVGPAHRAINAPAVRPRSTEPQPVRAKEGASV